jgi:uncharacterized protein
VNVAIAKDRPPRPFHVMAKPTGALCNLDCGYCFFLSKQMLYPASKFRMADDVLEGYLAQLFAAHGPGDVTIAWQGGEPTLAGIEFFERAVQVARRHARPDQRPVHCIQTNGVLVDRSWAAFFKHHDFLVGVSLDGPRALHDAYRVDKQGRPTFDRVMRGIRALKSAHVEWNVLTTLHRANAPYPREIYRFLRDTVGARYIQFIPIVERLGGSAAGGPAGTVRTGSDAGGRIFYMQDGNRAGERSITAEAYGRFLISVFDEWIQRDVGRVSVQAFDAAFAAWCGLPSPICVFASTCGSAVAVEHNGDVYACDHYVEPGYRLGNIADTPIRTLVDSGAQTSFGNAKLDTLTAECRACEFRFACHGGCPKDRFVAVERERHAHNYLCAGYKAFFHHVDRPMRLMRGLLAHRRSPAEIMRLYAGDDAKRGRYDPCPCGSGRKWKFCHGAPPPHPG